MLKFKYLFPLTILFITACSGGQLTGQSTIETKQQLTSSKCPPQEPCAPESDLEETALAYLESMIKGSCNQAADYWLPERRDRARELCTSGRLLPELQDESCQLSEFSSREISIEQLGAGFSVHISGEYLFECDQKTETYKVEDLILFFEEREGEWYLAGFNS